ncbi:MAG: hypothetical protein Q9174_000081 [Haloplaca sp. 1 TL-2023]
MAQVTNVYPQLLLARLGFSLGASCVATMVTAILPSMVSKDTPESGQRQDVDANDESRIQTHHKPRHHRLSGFVGFFTGLGALLAVGVYLQLPTRLQRMGVTPHQALIDTYYIAGTTAIIVALACVFGLRVQVYDTYDLMNARNSSSVRSRSLHFVSTIPEALRLTLSTPSLVLGILASFVARASSVGISLFIPLFVNSSLCNDAARDVDDVKTRCHRAYVVAAQLSGVSQLVALLFAPVFGYLPSRYRRLDVPLALATSAGIVGYVGFGMLNTSEAGPGLFFFVSLLGCSQIGVIVSSLSLVSSAVLDRQRSYEAGTRWKSQPAADTEATTLLHNELPATQTHEHLQGTVAGIYSFSGSLAILILTKLGGFLFDHTGSQMPFYLLALFNALLLLAAVGCAIMENFTDSV